MVDSILEGAALSQIALDDKAACGVLPIFAGGTALCGISFGAGSGSDGGCGGVESERTNRWFGPYAVIEMEDALLKGTDFPSSPVEKISNSKIGIHHFALSRETSFSFSSRQRNLNESG
jgi:hypothetical protein